MSRQRSTAVCREGWYYLLVLGFVLCGAMLREVNLLLVLAGMLIGPLVLSWRMVVVTLRGLEIRRRMPSGVCAGDPLVVNLQLDNGRSKIGSWAVSVEEQIDREGREPIRPMVLFPYVPAGQSRGRAYRSVLGRRGRYRLGPLRVSTRFPFGLIRRTVTLGETEWLTVFPRLGRLTGQWRLRQREALEGAQHRRWRHSRVEGDFFGVRDWRSGDSRRRINWRSSARHGTLVVSQFERPHNRNVAVLVDLWQPEKPSPADLEKVELAVSFAATVVTDLCRKGGSNLLLGRLDASGQAVRPQWTSGSASGALLREAVEQLALAEADHRDRLAELLEAASDRIEPDSEVILIGTRPIDDSSEASRQILGRRIRYINAADEELSRYFEIEGRGPHVAT